ncbi:DUF1772 domain-containing protein [Pedobacter yulinensis]|uniref:DUF1772 domain-containing protein n=1 Tax=Pedobacter yulinensis TaxID=2126353 RepID=A0A2T3HP23_9SPHI|nr:DUF1772 domain-containing protein [Pedobacter yulinensis]PST84157.1 DUF1772 domain-containing protein [Pedobacter yulinensis]
MKKVRHILTFAYSYLQVILTGTVVFQTFLMYPNIFRDPPASLQLSMKFFSAVTPADFFPPFGSLVVATAIPAVVLAFRDRPAFHLLLGSVLLLLAGDGILSILYFWPLNEALFTEGLSRYNAETLKEFAVDFQHAHHLRLLTSLVSSVLAMLGLMRCRFK